VERRPVWHELWFRITKWVISWLIKARERRGTVGPGPRVELRVSSTGNNFVLICMYVNPY